VSVAAAAVLSLVTLSVTAGQFNVSLKATRYRTTGSTLDVKKLSNLDFISDCTSSNGAKLVIEADDINSNITAVVTVDECGTILCTNLIVSAQCGQVAGQSNGKGAVAAALTFTSPDDSVNGVGFLLATGTTTNDTTIVSLKGKGTVTLCNTNGDVLTGTISISGPFKRGKNCL
jgi:hypothetical protein